SRSHFLGIASSGPCRGVPDRRGGLLMRGRKQTPPQLRVLNGNPSGIGVAKEIRAQVKRVAAEKHGRTANVGPVPSWLSPRARATWKRIVSEKGLAWLETIDREMLATFCAAYAPFVDAGGSDKAHGAG